MTIYMKLWKTLPRDFIYKPSKKTEKSEHIASIQQKVLTYPWWDATIKAWKGYKISP